MLTLLVYLPLQAATGAVMVDPVDRSVIGRGHPDSSHPLKHAVMVCIDSVAAGQGGGVWRGKRTRPSLLQTDTQCTASAVPEEGVSHVPSTGSSYSVNDSPPAPKKPKHEKQYLCSGYDLYTTKEPCVM